MSCNGKTCDPGDCSRGIPVYQQLDFAQLKYDKHFFALFDQKELAVKVYATRNFYSGTVTFFFVNELIKS